MTVLSPTTTLPQTAGALLNPTPPATPAALRGERCALRLRRRALIFLWETPGGGGPAGARPYAGGPPALPPLPRESGLALRARVAFGYRRQTTRRATGLAGVLALTRCGSAPAPYAMMSYFATSF